MLLVVNAWINPTATTSAPWNVQSALVEMPFSTPFYFAIRNCNGSTVGLSELAEYVIEINQIFCKEGKLVPASHYVRAQGLNNVGKEGFGFDKDEVRALLLILDIYIHLGG